MKQSKWSYLLALIWICAATLFALANLIFGIKMTELVEPFLVTVIFVILTGVSVLYTILGKIEEINERYESNNQKLQRRVK